MTAAETRTALGPGLRLGLCCLFKEQPIAFRATTATAVLKLSRHAALAKLSALCLANAGALYQAIVFCSEHGIGDFRVNSQVLPVKTHPQAGYDVAALPEGREIIRRFKSCGRLARQRGIRLTFHPDQFVLLSSPDPDVTRRSLADLEYQAEVGEWVGADVINIHGGGVYGDKDSALRRLANNLRRLSAPARRRLTLENDDKCYTPADLLPLCEAEGVPLVYDVHHHRCCPDRLSVKAATERAARTWDRQPLFHLSSPINGWDGPHPQRHHDYINVKDFPRAWRTMDITVEVEAKAKELAVLRLRDELRLGRPRTSGSKRVKGMDRGDRS